MPCSHKRLAGFDPDLSPNCRFGCSVPETVEHLLITCPHLSPARDLLKCECRTRDLRYDLKTLFTDDSLKLHVERFLSKIVYK